MVTTKNNHGDQKQSNFLNFLIFHILSDENPDKKCCLCRGFHCRDEGTVRKVQITYIGGLV